MSIKGQQDNALIPMYHQCERLGREHGWPIDVYGICKQGYGRDECLRQGLLSEAIDDLLPGDELRHKHGKAWSNQDESIRGHHRAL